MLKTVLSVACNTERGHNHGNMGCNASSPEEPPPAEPAEPPRAGKNKGMAGRPKSLRAPKWNSSEGAAGAQAQYAVIEAEEKVKSESKESDYGAYEGSFGYGGNAATNGRVKTEDEKDMKFPGTAPGVDAHAPCAEPSGRVGH